MSFAGSVGVLMQDSGLEDLLNAAFSGVAKILTDKKFPLCVKAYRRGVEELLRRVFTNSERPGPGSMEELDDYLESICNSSRTSKLWVSVFIK